METFNIIGQLVAILGGIFAGFFWLISFLDKKFTYFEKKFQGHVTQQQCRERRSILPCCTGEGTFKCPVTSGGDQSITAVLSRLTAVLQKAEKNK